MLGTVSRRALYTACVLGIAAFVQSSTVNAQGQAGLKSYKSDTKDFWQHPPPDWFLGDETQEQKGLAPKDGPPTGISGAELQNSLKNIKLPPGFSISVYADNVLAARQMAWATKAHSSSARSVSAMSTRSPIRAARKPSRRFSRA